jgi:hypothetical protein
MVEVTFKVVDFLGDGALGQHEALPMVRQVGRHLLAKLRENSTLSLPYDGPYCGRGPRRKYGQQVDDQPIPSTYWPSTSREQEIKPPIYQRSLWHKKFAERLQGVVIVKTNLHTPKTAHGVLFSRDFILGYELLSD